SASWSTLPSGRIGVTSATMLPTMGVMGGLRTVKPAILAAGQRRRPGLAHAGDDPLDAARRRRHHAVLVGDDRGVGVPLHHVEQFPRTQQELGPRRLPEGLLAVGE